VGGEGKAAALDELARDAEDARGLRTLEVETTDVGP
jgi:hypothetical protein